MDLLKIILQNVKDIKKLKKQVTCCTEVFSSVPEYADNAAAVTGGLNVGDIYRTGDVLKIVHT